MLVVAYPQSQKWQKNCTTTFRAVRRKVRKWNRKQEYIEQKDTCKGLINKKLGIFWCIFGAFFWT